MPKSSTFSGLLERATSQLQLEPDWASILQICDCIRQQDVTPKFAVAAIKKKMFDKNPHVAKFALIVLEACMKNCGSGVHEEIGTKEFMEEMRNLIRTGQEPVKDKALELIQTWAHVFRNETKYKIITDTYNLMKMEGCQFPSFKESEAMFSADCAPAWAEGDVCHMCRVKFGTFLRQHHCRKCGQVFCRKCSSKESIIPQFGIEREVRVCDPCYYQLNPQSKSDKSEQKTSSSSDNDLPAEYLNSALSKESQAPPKRDPQQLKDQEEEELQLAMALSLSQEEAQKEKKPLARSWPSPSDGISNGSSSSSSKLYSPATYDEEPETADMDPDLARYLNRSYWEGRHEQQSYPPPSAPEQLVSDGPAPYSNHAEPKKKKKSNLKAKSYQVLEKTSHVNPPAEEQVNEADQSSETLVNNFCSSLEMLSERMQTLSGKGKHIAMDATIQSLFQTVSAMHPQLLRLIEQQEGETEKYEALKERLGLVKEARTTLDNAREQHREKVRQQELEQDMLRRMQIEQKLELMRQQKAEYIAYQQRVQAERQMALEQQQQQLRLQKYGPQSFPGQPYAGQFGVSDGSSPYSSMGYIPPTSLPPQQGEGSPYSSLNYIPPSSGQGVTPTSIPTVPGGPNNMTNQQPPYTQPGSQNYPNQGFPENPASMDNQTRSQSPRLGQPPQSYQQMDYSQYTPDMTASMVNGQPQVPDYLQTPEVPGSTYPGQAAFPSSTYQSQASSQPPQHAQAANQQAPQGYLPQVNQSQTTYGSQQAQTGPPQFAPHQGHQLDTTGFGQPPPSQQPLQPQQQQPIQPQQQPLNAQQPLPSQQQQLYQPLPQHQQQTQPQHLQQQQQQPSQHHQPPTQHQQQQPLPPQQPHQQPIPPHHQQQPQQPPPPQHQQQPSPPQHQQQQPQLQHQQPPPPQHQQQPSPPQHQQQPPLQHQQQPPLQHQQQQPPQQQQQPPQQHQMYEPQPQQYQAPYSNPQQYQQPPVNQYYQQQPSGPPPQRQLSDLELISFD